MRAATRSGRLDEGRPVRDVFPMSTLAATLKRSAVPVACALVCAYFADQSTQADRRTILDLLHRVEHLGSTLRWGEAGRIAA